MRRVLVKGSVTSMKNRYLLLGVSLLCLVPADAPAQRTTYGVTVEVRNVAALSKVTTYAYLPGQPSFDKTLDQQIVSAIERELRTLGLTKAAQGSADVNVSYFSQRRTDVDLKSKPDAAGALRDTPSERCWCRSRKPQPRRGSSARAWSNLSNLIPRSSR